ncbi:MAG: hypothetical protein CO108_29050 [Deltaproteobacteria bacterium CG_4_9_14_3_um_filter_63_12]|nr:MAG: hypothetical protein CO108_29050 [Deltaproteobacteria bacterium CG_4_9_14_3_um_filter_63_12]
MKDSFIRHLLRCFVLALAVLFVLAACGDTKEPPPQAPPPAANHGAKKGKARKAAKEGSGNEIFSKGAVHLEDGPAIENMEAQEEETPQAIENAFWAYVIINNPTKLIQNIDRTSPNKINKDVASDAIAELYGLSKLQAIDWTKPALVAFLDGSDSPIIALTVIDRDEFITPFADPIRDRKGNQYSLPISVTRTVYINFWKDYVVISAEWRQFPLAQLTLESLLNAEHTKLIEGELDVERFPNLEKKLQQLLPVIPSLKVGWDETQAVVEELLTSCKSASVLLSESDDQLKLRIQLMPLDDGLLIDLMKDAKPGKAEPLMAFLPAVPYRFWLWHDLRQPGMDLDGLIVANFSELLRLKNLPASSLEAEFNRAKALAGPTVRAEVRDSRQSIAVAKIADGPRLEQANSDRAVGLKLRKDVKTLTVDEVFPPIPKSKKVPNPPPQPVVMTALELTLEDGTVLPSVEVLETDETVVAYAGDGIAALQGLPRVGENVGTQILADFDFLPGSPLAMLSLDLTKTDNSKPIQAGLVLTEKGLELYLLIPKSQLSAIGSL